MVTAAALALHEVLASMLMNCGPNWLTRTVSNTTNLMNDNVFWAFAPPVNANQPQVMTKGLQRHFVNLCVSYVVKNSKDWQKNELFFFNWSTHSRRAWFLLLGWGLYCTCTALYVRSCTYRVLRKKINSFRDWPKKQARVQYSYINEYLHCYLLLHRVRRQYVLTSTY